MWHRGGAVSDVGAVVGSVDQISWVSFVAGRVTVLQLNVDMVIVSIFALISSPTSSFASLQSNRIKTFPFGSVNTVVDAKIVAKIGGQGSWVSSVTPTSHIIVSIESF